MDARQTRRRRYVRAALMLASLTATAMLGYAAGSGLLAEATGWDVRPLLGHETSTDTAPALSDQLNTVVDQCRDFLARYWWWLAAPLAPLAVLALSLACFRNVPLPVFFVISLLIHAVPAIGMAYFLDEALLSQADKRAGQGGEEEAAELTEVAWLSDAPEVFEAMPLAYAELTELTSIETIGTLDALWRPSDLIELPRPLERLMPPVEPTRPALRPVGETAAAPERSADLPAKPAIAAADPPLLPRAAAGPAIDAQPIATIAPSAVAPAEERLPGPVAVGVARTEGGLAGQVANLPDVRQPASLPGERQVSNLPYAANEPAIYVPAELPTARGSTPTRTPARVEVIELAMAAPAGAATGGGRLPGAEVTVIRQPTTAGTPELVLPGGGAPSRWIAPDGTGRAGQGSGSGSMASAGAMPRIDVANSEPGRVGQETTGRRAAARNPSGSVVEPIPVELPRGTAPAGGTPNAGTGSGGPAITPVEVTVARAAGRGGEIDIRPTLLPPTGPATGRGGGRVGRETASPLPTFGAELARASQPSGGALARVLARENIKLEHALDLRQADVKDDALIALGGSRESREAVRRGLEWLKRHQHADGHWSLEKFYNELPGKDYSGKGNVASDTAATGFGLLPLLGDGHTHLAGEHQDAVRRGVRWLVANQKPDGELNVRAAYPTRMYAHAVATIALCEAYGMTKDAALREPAQRAIAFIVQSQHQQLGGWRYDPKNESDTSVLGWQVMALKSGQMAALDVPSRTFELVGQYLGRVEGKGNEFGQFRYRPNEQFTPAMAAEGLLCVQYLGAGRDDPRLTAGVKYLLSHLPQKGGDTSYYWYYGTQVLYHLQGEPWKQWNAALRDMLVATQLKDGHLAGTWDPKDQWEQRGGRLYATSLRLLMLEVYYRHLPLYRVYGQ
jgi:hypothetical protein